MSSKDKDKPVHERLKNFFKMKRDVPNKNKDDFVLTPELQQELGPDTPIVNRLKAIRELIDTINKCKLHEHVITKIWACIRDLPDDVVRDHRQLAFQLLQAVVHRQRLQMSGILRAAIFRAIADHKYHDETSLRFHLLQSLSENGKDISYFDEMMAPFLLQWLPEITKAGKTNDFMLLLITLIKFNAAHVRETEIHQFVIHICMLCDPSQEPIVFTSLNFLETLIAYYRNVPPDSLPQIIGTLCRVVNVEKYCQCSWKVMRNLLGTHLGHAALFTMCRILQSPDLTTNTYLIRGAIFFINMGLWGSPPIPTLRCPPSAVLPAIYEAVKINHPVVTYEVVISMQKLIQKYALDLQEPTWDVILKILAVATRAIEREQMAQSRVQAQVPLNETLTAIETLIDDGQFNGSLDDFYAIIEECAQLRPEASIMKLLVHLADDVHPVKCMWLGKLNDLLVGYYNVERERRTNVRLKVLDILINIVQLHRQFYEDELIDRIVIPHLIHLHTDCDYKIRSVGAGLLIALCTLCESRRCMEILDILEKLINRPFDISPENSPACDVDTADVKSIIPRLIDLFEAKIHKLPSMAAVRIYKMLMAHLETHYQRPRVFENCNYVRIQIFECFLRMRADDLYRIGCPRNGGQLVFSPYLCVTYTSPTDRSSIGSPPPSAASTAASPPIPTTMPSCIITYVAIKSAFKTMITCLTSERDMEVLILVLKRLPDVLQNKCLVLTKHGNNDIGLLIDAVSKLMKCLPDNATVNRMDFCTSLLLILSGLASYHAFLHPSHQQEMIRLLCTCKVRHGVPCFSKCIRALTTCTLEMQDVMVKILPEVLLQMSKTTATSQIAIPMLEFLSTLTILPSVFSNFVGDQYMAIFAMLLPYTNPFNYNTYTVFLAHHLIAVWFLKCRLNFRKDFVSYITNGLHTNALTPFDESPVMKAGGDVNRLNQDSSNRKRSSSLTEQSSRKRERSATLVTKFDFRPAPIDKTLMSFYRELTETCIDLMARYTFSPCSALPKRLPNAEFLFSGGQSMSWLLGNRVITITTSGCAQKALKHGLCDKCYATCKRGQAGGTASIDSTRVTRQNSGSNNNSPTEERAGGSRLEQLPNKLQQLELHRVVEKKENCACWCQNWAEIHVRRPTGNMSWVMRIQNQTADVKNIYDFPLNEICTLFMPSLNGVEPQTHESIEEEEDAKLATTCSTSMMEDAGNGQATQPISIPGSPSKTQSPRDSIDDDIDYIVYEDGTRMRNPVRRSNSSPEMSANWKNPFLIQRSGEQKDTDAEDHSKKKNQFAKDMRGVSCEAIPEEIAGMPGTTPPSNDPPPSPAATSSAQHPALLSSLSCPGPDATDPPLTIPKAYQTVPPTPNPREFYSRTSSNDRPTLHLPLTSKPPQSPTQTSPRLSRHNRDGGHEIQKSSSLVLQKQKKHLDGFNQPELKHRDRLHTVSVMQQSPIRKPRLDLSSLAPTTGGTTSNSTSTSSTSSSGGKNKDGPKSGINPAFVFLQLYHAAQFGNAAEKPLLINSNDVVQRALHILDIIQPYETHKIGVIYIGQGQCNKEPDILRNCYGSLRYTEFLKRLGSMIRVPDADPQAFFLGGLDHDGADGKFAYMWQDDIIRVIFHVATLMPFSEFDPNCNQKKAHIGNDFVTIVYNESGEDYNIGTIKGQFNFASIIIQPLDHNSNKVIVKAKDAIVELIGNCEARIVSDQNVALLARQLALHANLAALIQSNSMKESSEPYAPNWLQRLRRIKNLRQKIQQSSSSSSSRDPPGSAGPLGGAGGGGSANDYSARTRPAQMEDFTEYT